MLNNIINNTDIASNSRLTQQDSLNSILGSNAVKRGMSNPISNSDLLIDSSDISNRAVRMYERELDIKNFTNLATSDPQNESHNEMVKELFSKGVIDVFEDSSIMSLAKNQALIDDLGL